jgi:peroxiredoxin Q/BCP
MPDLKEGQQAPDFKLPSSTGKDISLKDFKGKKVVLFFYVKDATPG